MGTEKRRCSLRSHLEQHRSVPLLSFFFQSLFYTLYILFNLLEQPEQVYKRQQLHRNNCGTHWNILELCYFSIYLSTKVITRRFLIFITFEKISSKSSAATALTSFASVFSRFFLSTFRD